MVRGYMEESDAANIEARLAQLGKGGYFSKRDAGEMLQAGSYRPSSPFPIDRPFEPPRDN
jgi:hypothetical protein